MKFIRILKFFYRPVRDGLLDLTHIILGIIPKKKNLIVLTSWFGERYADNSMYLYEYLLENNKTVVWSTKNISVYKLLSDKHYPVINSKTIKGKWTIIRAECLISTVQLSDYNPKYLTNCIFLDLDHGIPFKQAGYSIVDNDNAYLIKRDIILTRRIHYYLTATSYPCAIMLSHIYNVPLDHILLSGKPRDDVFFHTELLKKNNDLDCIINNRKTIVYLPTHRNCGKVLLNVEDHFDFDYINKLCKDNNCIFLIKKHFYHRNESLNLSNYSNIRDITDLNVDTQYLLYKSDILITDYSSVCPEYLLLDRPVILYPYDYEHFLKYDRDLFFNLNDITFVEKVTNKLEMNNSISNLINGIDQYVELRKKFKELFFDTRLYNNARETITEYIYNLIEDKNYRFDWSSYENEYNNDNELSELVNQLKSL